ncbi:MAG: SDR family oxidoreductase [Candidatus Omnitrophica bacterium]|nr:SDR family oxidoreductase [Candidatus Omnitrophota bacterium]
MDFGLKGKKALITGGTSGMGKESVKLLLKEGVYVAINYFHNDKKANETYEELKKFGELILVKGDVGNYKECEKVVNEVLKNFGTIDILVHCAGIAQPNEDTPENWDLVIKTHLYSCYNLDKHISPIMIEKKSGKIIIISSIGAHSTWPNAYCAAMAGKICYAKGLAKKLAPFGINVNTISPGTIFTPMLDPFIPVEKRREFTEKNIPLYKSKNGYPTAIEIAKVVLFLCSDLSSHITGEDIKVDGGEFIHY